MLALIIGTAVAVIGACVSVPQTARVLHRRDVAGLSVTSYLGWTVSWALWAWYSFSVGAYPKAASETLGFAMDSVLLATILFVTGAGALRALGRAALLITPGIAAVVATGLIFGPVAFAVALTVFDIAVIGPQILQVIRAPSLSGLSLVSYVLRATVAGGWVAYGLALGHPEVGGWGFVICPFALYVCARIIASRRRTDAPAAPVPA